MKKALLLILLWLANQPSQAAIFCVDNAADLKSALIAAQANGEDDHIKLKPGDYIAISSQDFRFLLQENHAIKISGGWFDIGNLDCILQSGDPLDTVLDGDDQFLVLWIGESGPLNMSATIVIDNLTISNGQSDSQSIFAAGMTLYFPDVNYNGQVLIDRVLFFSNDAEKTTALSVHHGNLVTIRNSVMAFNRSTDGAGTVTLNMDPNNSQVFFINNTLVNNSHDNPNPSQFTNSGLFVTNIDQLFMANNIFWYNEDDDIHFFQNSPYYQVYHNNFQSMAGATADEMVNNLSIEPMLSQLLLGFFPLPGSPMIDQGLPMPELVSMTDVLGFGWNHGTLDHECKNRKINRRVDIGAVEAVAEIPIFADDFESP